LLEVKAVLSQSRIVIPVGRFGQCVGKGCARTGFVRHSQTSFYARTIGNGSGRIWTARYVRNCLLEHQGHRALGCGSTADHAVAYYQGAIKNNVHCCGHDQEQGLGPRHQSAELENSAARTIVLNVAALAVGTRLTQRRNFSCWPDEIEEDGYQPDRRRYVRVE